MRDTTNTERQSRGEKGRVPLKYSVNSPSWATSGINVTRAPTSTNKTTTPAHMMTPPKTAAAAAATTTSAATAATATTAATAGQRATTTKTTHTPLHTKQWYIYVKTNYLDGPFPLPSSCQSADAGSYRVGIGLYPTPTHLSLQIQRLFPSVKCSRRSRNMSQRIGGRSLSLHYCQDWHQHHAGLFVVTGVTMTTPVMIPQPKHIHEQHYYHQHQ